MADTNIILKYRRPQDSWLCPECDAENTLSYSRCTVCGCGKFGTPTIVKAWSVADEKPPANPVVPTANPNPAGRPSVGFGKMTPSYTASGKEMGRPVYTPPKTHSHTAIIWTAVILVIVLFLIWMVNNA